MRNQASALHREYYIGFGGEDRVAAEKFMMRLFTFHNTWRENTPVTLGYVISYIKM